MKFQAFLLKTGSGKLLERLCQMLIFHDVKLASRPFTLCGLSGEVGNASSLSHDLINSKSRVEVIRRMQDRYIFGNPDDSSEDYVTGDHGLGPEFSPDA